MKKLFLLIITVVMLVANVMAEDYRIDSVYHYFTFKDNPAASKTINHYNAKGQKIQEDSYYMENSKWTEGSSIYYEYNSDGLLSTSTKVSEGKNGKWHTQDVYHYKDTLVSLIENRYKRDTAEWETSSYKEFEYNTQNLLVRESWLRKDMSEQKRYVNMYDSNGNRVEHSVYEWLQEGFVPGVRTTYLYNENNLLVQEKKYLRNRLSEQISYDYDARHFLIQDVKYIEHEGIMHPLFKCTYKNNADGKAILRLLYSNNGFKGEFVISTKQESTYDNMGNLTSQTNWGYIRGNWYPLSDSDERWIYYYTTLK